MATRRYRLLCPIARALDHVGDRWALLILRDLHAGPVRHRDLAAGLAGIPSNLLATRLKELVASGLVEKTKSPHGVALYQLTEAGRATAPVLHSLARLGTHFAPEPEPRRPGNLRLVAVTLAGALERVVQPDDTLTVDLRIDGESLEVVLAGGRASVLYRPPESPDLVIDAAYEPLVALADGAIDTAELGRHVHVVRGEPEVAERFMARLVEAFTRF